MKRITTYLLLLCVALAFSACREKEQPAVSTMKGVFYAFVDGAEETVELLPNKSKTFTLLARAEAVSDVYLTFSFKVDPDAVATYNAAHGTDYEMLPSSAFEFIDNTVMMPRYNKASSSARLRITASGLEEEKVYVLPVTIDKVTGTDNWALAAEPHAFVTVTQLMTGPQGGDGSAEYPYILSTPEDMEKMSEKLEHENKVYFKMKNDIDMASVTAWIPLNYASPYDFEIDFDGAGHTISNFSVDFTNYSSFFGVLYGKCHDVTFTNAYVTSSANSACGIIGGYAGTGDKHAEITRVHVQGVVDFKGNKTGIGGLAGILGNATVTASSADCVVTSGYNYVGGLFGYDGGKCEVSDCWTAGSVTGGQRTGGICGGIIKAESSLSNCYSLSEVHAGFAIGGIAGHCNLDQKSGTPEESRPDNVFSKCIAWNDCVRATALTPGDVSHYSCGAVIGFTSVRNYLIDCVRKPDMDFQDYSDMFTVYDQPNASPDAPLMVNAVSGASYNYPYHGRAAEAGKTLSQVAKELGWSADIWDFGGDVPTLKANASVVPVEDATSNGQLPGYGENELY
jgi:hypothetical protein